MNNNLAEFTGQIINIFENFLERKGIDIENKEKEDSDCPAIIYGSDYGHIQSEIEETLMDWNIDLTKDDNYIVSLDVDHDERSFIDEDFIKDSIEIGFNTGDVRTQVVSINRIGEE